MLTYILFVIGFLLLIQGASFLADGATSIARRFNVSDLVIGSTVVAFGTSTPELFVNIIASIKGNSDIAIDNVLGRNRLFDTLAWLCRISHRQSKINPGFIPVRR